MKLGELGGQSRGAARVLAACFREHNLLTYASAIAFQLLVALIPLTLLGLVLLGWLDAQSVWEDSIAPAMSERLSSSTFIAIDNIVDNIIASKHVVWLVFGVLLTVWEVSGSVRASMGALNEILELKEDRPTWRRFGLSSALAVAVSLSILLALLVVTVGPRLLDGLPGAMASIFRWGAAIVLLWLSLALLIRYAPAERQPIRWVSVGSVLVIGAWIVVSLGYRYYVEHVADFQSALGTAIAGLLLTGYLYVSAIVFVAGAQIDELLRRQATARYAAAP